MQDSRVKRRQENETKKYLLLTILVGIIVIGVAFVFGIPLLVQFSTFMSKVSGNNSTVAQSDNPSFISPPELSLPFEATNSAKIAITGEVIQGEKVKLYLNDEAKDEVDVKDDKTFKFKNIALAEGDNKIEALVITENNKKSNFSSPIHVFYIKNPPVLDVNTPAENQEFHGGESNPILVSGKTDPRAKVTVNGFWAIIDSDGNYSYNLSIHEGDNQIDVKSTDQAGNSVSKTLKIKFSP